MGNLDGQVWWAVTIKFGPIHDISERAFLTGIRARTVFQLSPELQRPWVVMDGEQFLAVLCKFSDRSATSSC